MAYYYSEKGQKVSLNDTIEGFSYGTSADGKCRCGMVNTLILIMLLLVLGGMGFYLYKNKDKKE